MAVRLRRHVLKCVASFLRKPRCVQAQTSVRFVSNRNQDADSSSGFRTPTRRANRQHCSAANVEKEFFKKSQIKSTSCLYTRRRGLLARESAFHQQRIWKEEESKNETLNSHLCTVLLARPVAGGRAASPPLHAAFSAFVRCTTPPPSRLPLTLPLSPAHHPRPPQDVCRGAQRDKFRH